MSFLGSPDIWVRRKIQLVVNALIYNLLLHEYLHALGELSEDEVKRLVVVIGKKCFGEEHIVTTIARKTPWNTPSRDIPCRARQCAEARDGDCGTTTINGKYIS